MKYDSNLFIYLRVKLDSQFPEILLTCNKDKKRYVTT